MLDGHIPSTRIRRELGETKQAVHDSAATIAEIAVSEFIDQDDARRACEIASIFAKGYTGALDSMESSMITSQQAQQQLATVLDALRQYSSN